MTNEVSVCVFALRSLSQILKNSHPELKISDDDLLRQQQKLVLGDS